MARLDARVLVFDFENIRGEIQSFAGGTTQGKIDAFMSKITQGRKVVYTEEIIQPSTVHCISCRVH